MIRILISAFLAILLSFLYLKIFQSSKFPDSILNGGFINFLIKNHQQIIGVMIGFMAASYFAFTPWLMNIPNSLNGTIINKSSSLKNEPVKTIGKIIEIHTTNKNTELSIHYDGNNKKFIINNKVIQDRLKVGDNITVFYDPKNTELAYLDFCNSLDLDEKVQTIQDSDVLFKLIEITPRFDMGSNIFELLGEFHGGQYQGKKGSLIHEFPREDIAQYTPGSLFPCVISGTKNNYSIKLLTSS